MSYKDGTGDFVPRYVCFLTNRRVKQSKKPQILKTRSSPFFAKLASLRKIRNFQEKVIFTKVDMMGINRFGTICQVQ
ncbi:hypothetical protein T4B_13657 [Trichinella pseudospiralis]|uniref:Uncharacterized protein n=1 Tax=Trichinella pseudospiralis TaxID=6337 RepID=A0A0V1GN65_TRIPS|nr:hypothetical protein T4B_13657 [Trichinella pseudospiralis]